MISEPIFSTPEPIRKAPLLAMVSSKQQYDSYRNRTFAIVEMMALSKELSNLKSGQELGNDSCKVQPEDLSMSFIDACRTIHEDEDYIKANMTSLWHSDELEAPSLSSTSTFSDSGSLCHEEVTHAVLMPFPETSHTSTNGPVDTYFDFEICPEDMNSVTIQRLDEGMVPTDEDWQVAIGERNNAYAGIDVDILASQCSSLNMSECSEAEIVSQLRHALNVEHSRVSANVRRGAQQYVAIENTLKNIHALHGPHNGYESEVWTHFNEFKFFRDANFATDVPYIHAPKPRRPNSKVRQIRFNTNVLVTSQELVDRHWSSQEGITTMVHQLSFQTGQKYAHRKSIVRKKALGMAVNPTEQFMLRRYDFFARIRDFTLCRAMPRFMDSASAEQELQWISNGIKARLQTYVDVEVVSGALLKLADLKVNYQYMQEVFSTAKRQGLKGTSIPSFEYMVHWRQHMDAYTLLRANRIPQMFSDHLLDEEITQALSEQAAFEAAEKRMGEVRVAHMAEQTGAPKPTGAEPAEEKMCLTELNEAIFELWAQLELLELQPKINDIARLTALYEKRTADLVKDITTCGYRAREIRAQNDQWRTNIMEDIQEFWRPIYRAEVLAKHNLCVSPKLADNEASQDESSITPQPAPLLKTGRRKPRGTVKFAGEPVKVTQICDIDATMNGPVRTRSVSLPSVLRPAIPNRNRSRSLC